MHMPFATGMRSDLQCCHRRRRVPGQPARRARVARQGRRPLVRATTSNGLDLPLPPGRRRLLTDPHQRSCSPAERHTCSPPWGDAASTPGHGRHRPRHRDRHGLSSKSPPTHAGDPRCATERRALGPHNRRSPPGPEILRGTTPAMRTGRAGPPRRPGGLARRAWLANGPLRFPCPGSGKAHGTSMTADRSG